MEDNGVDLDPVSLYVMGRNYYNTNRISEGCDYLDKARKFGQKSAEKDYLRLCN